MPHPAQEGTRVQLERSFGAREAALCVCALILFGLVLNAALRVAWHYSPWFREVASTSPEAIQIGTRSLRALFWIMVAYWCVRASSPADFVSRVGLRNWPNSSQIPLVLIAVGIAILNLIGVNQDWGTSADQMPPPLLSRGTSIVFVVLLAPLFEEIVFRGFLYKAFRANCGIVLSILLTMAVSTYFHWGLLMESFFGFACITVLGTYQCILRERTGNTWLCILCHSAYNAAVTWEWLLVLAVIATVPLFESRRFHNA